jgi:hypothetical protein
MEDDYLDDVDPEEGSRKNKKKRSRKERREYKARLERSALPWKRVKVDERVHFQEGGLFSLEELHYEGDVNSPDFLKSLLAGASEPVLSEGDKSKFKFYDDGEIPAETDDADAGALFFLLPVCVAW